MKSVKETKKEVVPKQNIPISRLKQKNTKGKQSIENDIVSKKLKAKARFEKRVKAKEDELEAGRREYMKSRIRKLLWLSTSSIIVMVSVGSIVIMLLITSNKNIDLSHIFEKPRFEKEFVSVNGKLVNPIDFTPVAGANMIAGETAIYTPDTGEYRFQSVSTESGIRITHPKVIKAVVKKVKNDGQLNIYYIPDLMNTMIDIVYLESKQYHDQVYYKYIDESIQKDISMLQYTKKVNTIFDKHDLSDQQLEVGKTIFYEEWKSQITNKSFQSVIQMEIYNEEKKKDYYLSYVGGIWKLVY